MFLFGWSLTLFVSWSLGKLLLRKVMRPPVPPGEDVFAFLAGSACLSAMVVFFWRQCTWSIGPYFSRAWDSGDRISHVLGGGGVAASQCPDASTVEAAVRRHLARIRRGLLCLCSRTRKQPGWQHLPSGSGSPVRPGARIPRHLADNFYAKPSGRPGMLFLLRSCGGGTRQQRWCIARTCCCYPC